MLKAFQIPGGGQAASPGSNLQVPLFGLLIGEIGNPNSDAAVESTLVRLANRELFN
jgi:hypothetical protein